MDLAAWGIDDGWWDTAGHWQAVDPASIGAIARSMGAPDDPDDGARPPEGPPWWFVRAGHVEFLQGPADLVLEDGTTIADAEALPPDLPPGYHQLVPADGGPTTHLVVTPGRCHLPPGLHTWGWAVQLYAARSRASWGIGDLSDLRQLQRWAAEQGAGMLAVNPLHAAGPALPQQASPYYPSSRCFRNPIYLRVEAVPGAADAGADVDRLAALGRALDDDRLIDRDRVWALKREALEACFVHTDLGRGLPPALPQDRASLLRFATFCAIADEYGNGWPSWPTELRDPASPAVRRYAEEHPRAVAFHCWLQDLLDEQLAGPDELPVIHDLAVGFDAGGADAWAWQDLLALDMRIGAPPDDFNADGQDWGLPPFVPWKLRAAGFEPFIETVRASLRHAGGLRIDHVMGLFRLFWLPAGGGPRAGGYVRYPAGELLDILALESHRARALVVGEDLGTVEEGVRAELHQRGILSTRLVWFEPGPPESYPDQAVAAVTTHDLPTIAGVWSGTDADDQRSAGISPPEGAQGELHQRLGEVAGVAEGAPVGDVVVATYRALAAAPSALVLATLDDALGVTERPNMPGTIDEWPNWCLALPRPIEEIVEDPGVLAVGHALTDRRR